MYKLSNNVSEPIHFVIRGRLTRRTSLPKVVENFLYSLVILKSKVRRITKYYKTLLTEYLRITDPINLNFY